MRAMPTIRGAIAAAMVAFVSLATVTPAQALIVAGRWDPLYGLPFVGSNPDPLVTSDDMWWSGAGQFFFGNDCALPAAGSGEVLVSGCTMRLQNSFIDLSVGQANADTPFETLNFGGSVTIFEAKFVNGQLVGVISDFFDPWVQGTSDTFNVNQYEFTYALSYAGALLYHATLADFVEKHDHGHVDADHFWNGVGNGHLTLACSGVAQVDGIQCGFSDTYASVSFDEIPGINPNAIIPEPQTYALMLLGLGAIGFSARRRQRNAR